jgi:benzylsuccinate CoA-transferase BbsE subunit
MSSTTQSGTRSPAALSGGALEGLRVLEVVGTGTAYAGRLLAGMGADVVLIEPPEGAPERHEGPFFDGVAGFERSLSFAYLHVGKRSIALDLDSADGQALFKRLVAISDIVLEGSPPGTMASRGLAYEDLAQIRPSLVYTSVSPFGSDGPYRDLAATDLTLLAMGGLLCLGGYSDAQPVRAHGNQALLAGAQFAAVGTMIAVLDAESSGVGQRVDVSIQECVTMALENAIQYYDLEGVVRKRRAGWQVNAGSGVFPCKDGDVYLLTGDFGSHWSELGNWLTGDGFPAGAEFLNEKWGTREWLVTDEAKESFLEIFLPFSKSKEKVELYEGGKVRKIPLCPISTPEDIAKSDQLEVREYFTTVVDSLRARSVTMPGAPFICSETPFTISRPAPTFGEHTVEICQQVEIDVEAVQRYFEARVIA